MKLQLKAINKKGLQHFSKTPVFKAEEGVTRTDARPEFLRGHGLNVISFLFRPAIAAGNLPKPQIKSGTDQGFQRKSTEEQSAPGKNVDTHHLAVGGAGWFYGGHLELEPIGILILAGAWLGSRD